MSVNSQSQTLVIKDWLKSAVRQLSDIGIASACLDAEIILSNTLNKNRTYLHAHGNEVLDGRIIKITNKQLSQRLGRMPIAYIIGHKEFYGREFIVNSDTLIPRPESEDIITLLSRILPTKTFGLPPTKLIDVGTGCGCLGITAKLEFPRLDVTLTDISEKSLKIARTNANRLSTDVSFLQGDLLLNFSARADIIIANLPYVDSAWKRSPETEYEPSLALFADKHGLSIIDRFIPIIHNSLNRDGHLIIEADPTQHEAIVKSAKKQSLVKTHQLGYALSFKFEKK